ncbi:MAG: hypothetical protein ACE5I5_13490 [Candidatus Heimdallarchaeota archaeon]
MLKSKIPTSEYIVAKFGGSCLDSGMGIRKAARIVKSLIERNFEVVIVVSALQGTTDALIQISEEATSGFLDVTRRDEILSMGERTSAILFSNILQMNDIKSEVFSPDQERFPILTDDQFGNANPLIKESREKVQAVLLPLLKKRIIPVVCGFTGRTREGRVTTLGRGGSDTTAMILGNCLGAKEVILVKDVNGILSADPKKVENPSFIEEIDVEELGILASSGTEIVCFKALNYKPSWMDVRIVGLSANNVFENGTIIKGGYASSLEIDSFKAPVTMVTIVGRSAGSSKALTSYERIVRNRNDEILGEIVDPRSLLIYLSSTDSENLLQEFHNVLNEEKFGRALTSFDNLAMVDIRGKKLETIPGLIQSVSDPLFQNGINLFGLLTVNSTIRIFVRWDDRQKTIELIQNALGVEKY